MPQLRSASPPPKRVRLERNYQNVQSHAPASPHPPTLSLSHHDRNVISSDSNERQQSRMPSDDSLPPLSLSILGVEPLDEFIKEIADFVHHMIMTRPHDVPGVVEVEAKIGLLRDKVTRQRIALPVLVESILVPETIDCHFESNMSVHQHKHYNQLLNNLKTNSVQPMHLASPLGYSHLYLVDTFYQSEHGGKVRVTRDEKTRTVSECVRKVRLGNLDIYSPKRAADWRISVNLEIPVPHPVGSATHTRRKDRMSYSHEEFNIDLTQVTSTATPGVPPQVLHELELEIARPEFLLVAAAKRGDMNVPEHERSAFDELIRAFVNNARILVRNAGDHVWQ